LNDKNYDVAIMGGGPAGYTAAFELTKRGKSVVLFETDKVGGTCLHHGCIPMKSLLHNEGNMPVAESIEKAAKDTGILYRGLSDRLKQTSVDMIPSFCRIDGRSDDGFLLKAEDDKYTASNIIIATGSEQTLPPIDGLEKGRSDGWILLTEDALRFTGWGTKVAIVGAGVTGLEFATYLSKLGIKVVILELADDILSGAMDDDVQEVSRRNLEGIEIICAAIVCEFDDHTVIYQKDGNYEEIAVDQVLLASGRKGRINDIGLESIGVETSHGFIVTDERCKTNVNGIYACGDINGKDMLAHVAYKEAESAAINICGDDTDVSYDAVPKVVFTDPEFASVGVNEKTLLKNGEVEGTDFHIRKCPMTYSSRYVILEGLKSGVCKLIFDRKEKLIGAQILGNGADELIAWLADMVTRGETLNDIRNKIYPHPGICEVIREAVS